MRDCRQEFILRTAGFLSPTPGDFGLAARLLLVSEQLFSRFFHSLTFSDVAKAQHDPDDMSAFVLYRRGASVNRRLPSAPGDEEGVIDEAGGGVFLQNPHNRAFTRPSRLLVDDPEDFLQRPAFGFRLGPSDHYLRHRIDQCHASFQIGCYDRVADAAHHGFQPGFPPPHLLFGLSQAQDRPNVSDQFLGLNWLGQISVRAALEPTYAITDFSESRRAMNHQYRFD